MAKRTFKQADVPPRRRAVGIGTTSPIFTADDVTSIASKALPIMKGRNPDHIAVAWSDAFFHAAEFLPFEVHDAPSQLRDFYAGVDEAARALLKALGFTGNPAFVIGEAEARGAPSADAIGHLKGLLTPAKAGDVPLHVSLARRVSAPDWKPGDPLPINAALEAAPYAVALLAMTARIGRESYARAPSAKSGPKRSKFRQELFEVLAGSFGYAFGYEPDTSSERLQRDNASQVWIAWLFSTAAERLAGCILLDMTGEAERSRLAAAHPLVCKVRETAQLKPGTLANLLAEGQRRRPGDEPGVVASF